MAPSPSGGNRYHRLLLRPRGSSFCCVAFARAHASKAGDQAYPAGRTLFVVNLPHACTADALSAALTKLGDVASVSIGALAADAADAAAGMALGARTAHVVFKSAAGLKKAMRTDRCLMLGAVQRSLEAKAEAPSREELQQSVDEFMRQFERDEERRLKEEEMAHNRMDADGFVVVTRKRKGRNSSTDGEVTVGAASEAAQAARAAKRAKKKREDPLDFYHFQRHERKREQLTKLREQFEADKARIAKMRMDRKFKPL